MAYINLNAAETVTLDTTGCLPGAADPVFHLLNATTFAQLAFDDDSGGGHNSRIVFTSPSTQTVILFMRSYGNTSSGTCTVRKNGATLDADMPVGGTHIQTNEVSFQANDHLRTQHAPGGSVAPTLAKFTGSGTNLTALGLGNAPGKSSRITQSSSDYRYLLGTPWTRVGSAPPVTLRPGATRVLANDYWADSDLDGLGDGLELALGTCATVAPCVSMNASMHTGLDTDRDGLGDFEEVFGVVGALPNGADDIPFARWGANPRVKDVFVEVDYVHDLNVLGGDMDVLAPGENPFRWLRDHPNSPTGFFQNKTLEQWVDEVTAPFALGPRAQLKNVDNVDGVAVHLDIGVSPLKLDPARERQFGDYGGSARAIARDFVFRVKETTTGFVWVSINWSTISVYANGLTRLQLATAIASAAVSIGPIHVKAGFPRTETNGEVTVSLEANVPGVHFARAILADEPTKFELLDEDEESLRNAYDNEPEQVAPNRRGRFRYGVIWSGGQTGSPKFNVSLATRPFVHELGHTLGLRHNGHSQWGNDIAGGRDANCIPQYDSVMRYGDTAYIRFTDSETPLSLNPVAVREPYTFGGLFDHYIFALAPASYSANSSFVDWNRNGVADLGLDLAFRAAALLLVKASCNAFSFNPQVLSTDPAIRGPVDLARLGNQLYAFWAGSSGWALKTKFATLGAVGSKSCTGPSDPAQGHCLSWSSTYTLATDLQQYGGVSALAFDNSMFAASQAASSAIYVYRYTQNSNGTLQPASSWVFGLNPQDRSDKTPELTVLFDGGPPTLGLLYLAQSGEFRQRRWTGSGWSSSTAITTAAGTPITGSEGPVAKGWPDADVAGWTNAERRTLAILPNPSGTMPIYRLEHQTLSSAWTKIQSIGKFSANKPAFEFRANRASTGQLYPYLNGAPTFQGNFVIAWSDGRASNGTDVPTMVRLTEVVDRSNPPSASLQGLWEDFLADKWTNNVSTTAVSLYSDSTIDNVFGLAVWKDGLTFLPHADGAPNHTYTTRSDFMVMEDRICGEIKPPTWCGPVEVLE